MFEKYNINNLYLAYVLEIRPVNSWLLPYVSIGYYTILKKNGENYIDLQNKNRIVNQYIIPNEKCYIIYEIEPFIACCTINSEKYNKISKKKVLSLSRKYEHIISKKIYERSKSI